MLIQRLQKLPYNTRVKILWVSFVVAAIGLVIIFTNSISHTIRGTSGDKLIELNPTSSYPEATIKFANVEWIEQTDQYLKIYFNLNNTTNDILNAPKIGEIKLKVANDLIAPQTMTDRQGEAFVQKILSNTQNFGILRFANLNANEAELILGGMSLENEPTKEFQQTLKLNFDELNNPSNIRK